MQKQINIFMISLFKNYVDFFKDDKMQLFFLLFCTINASLHLHLVLLKSKRIVGILALILVLLVIDFTIIIIILHVFIVLMMVLLFMMSTSVQSLLLLHLLLGQLARHQVLPRLLLPLVVLPRLFLLESLQAHPLFVATCLSFISHLFLNFFSPV